MSSLPSMSTLTTAGGTSAADWCFSSMSERPRACTTSAKGQASMLPLCESSQFMPWFSSERTAKQTRESRGATASGTTTRPSHLLRYLVHARRAAEVG